MAKSVNKVFLIGRLTQDVEVRTTPSGKNVASFTLAVDRMAKDDGVDFFDVQAWDKLADVLSQYTSKGSKLHVEGRLKQDTWEDKESGKKRSKVVINANDITFLDSKADAAAGKSKDVVPEDIDDKPVDLSAIPF